MASQSTLAWAQTDEERSGARAAASEGAKAFNESRFADAIDLFTRAQSLVKAPPHLLYIARSHEKLGQLVKARENYLQIKRAKIAGDAPAAFKEAQQAAETDLAALEPRLPYVTVNVQGASAAQVTVTMDGAQIPSALVGIPRPVDPGEHKFQAFAKDMESEVSIVSVKEGGKETVALTLVSKPGAGTPAGGEGGAASPAGGDGTPGDAGPKDSGSNGMKIGAYVALGVGAVGLGLGTVFALSASGKYSDGDDLFDKSGCSKGTGPGTSCDKSVQDEIVSLDEDGDSAKTLSFIGFGAGIVGIGAGVTLLILSSSKGGSSSASHAPPAVLPWVGYKSAGVMGHF